MNLHFKLFQKNDYNQYYKDSLAEFLEDVTEKCKSTDNYDVCMTKQRNAFDASFNTLKSQLIREDNLDLKYEKWDKFKTLRWDSDRRNKFQ